MKMMVNKRRADVRRLVRQALKEASLKEKQIDTIDPLVVCAQRLFPYKHEDTIYEYARTALRVIRNQSPIQTRLNSHQTTLLIHIPLTHFRTTH